MLQNSFSAGTHSTAREREAFSFLSSVDAVLFSNVCVAGSIIHCRIIKTANVSFGRCSPGRKQELYLNISGAAVNLLRRAQFLCALYVLAVN